jgi:hypothetical protein
MDNNADDKQIWEHILLHWAHEDRTLNPTEGIILNRLNTCINLALYHTQLIIEEVEPSQPVIAKPEHNHNYKSLNHSLPSQPMSCSISRSCSSILTKCRQICTRVACLGRSATSTGSHMARSVLPTR